LKVDKPVLDGQESNRCATCPLDYDGSVMRHRDSHCYKWHRTHGCDCPRNMEEYAEACALTEAANTGEVTK
jgi:hypothetical protein